MRAERLLEVVRDLKTEFDESESAKHLADLVKALRAQAEDPDAEHEKATEEARKAFFSSTENSPLDVYPPSMREILISMKLPTVFGVALAEDVRKIIAEFSATPNVLADKLELKKSQIEVVERHTANALLAMEYFEVEPDDLAPGEFEIMVAIPGPAISDELEQLGREALNINRLLSVFVELATGEREPIKVRAIASTDPTFFLYAAPGVAVVVIGALERLAGLYEKVLGLVKLHRELRAADAGPDVLDPVQKLIDERVAAQLETIRDDLLAAAPARARDAGRQHELSNELNRTLRELLRRMDEGYLFDVRSGPAPSAAEAEGEAPVESQAVTEARKLVEESRPAIRHFEAAGEPVLRLIGPQDR